MTFRVKGELAVTQRLRVGNEVRSNIPIGVNSLAAATTGSRNTALGAGGLANLTTGDDNIAIGVNALQNNVSGPLNIAIGSSALQNASSPSDNIAIGFQAISAGAAGSNNIAIGAQALQNDTTGTANIALGIQNLQANTTGSFNVSVGVSASGSVTTGSGNVCLGVGAGTTITTGSFNTCVGNSVSAGAGAGTGRIAIGCSSANLPATAVTDNGLFFHNAVATAAGAAVQYNAVTGQMGPVASSLRFKENITEGGSDSSRIFALKPVTYNLIGAASTTREFGFLAEDVVDVIPEIAPRDAQGLPMSVNYDRLTVLIIEELKKLRDEVTEIRQAVFAA